MESINVLMQEANHLTRGLTEHLDELVERRSGGGGVVPVPSLHAIHSALASQHDHVRAQYNNVRKTLPFFFCLFVCCLLICFWVTLFGLCLVGS